MTQDIQPRHVSKWRATRSRDVGLPVQDALDERNPAAWRVRLPAPQQIRGTRRQTEAAVDAVGDQGVVRGMMGVESGSHVGHSLPNQYRLVTRVCEGCRSSDSVERRDATTGTGGHVEGQRESDRLLVREQGSSAAWDDMPWR